MMEINKKQIRKNELRIIFDEMTVEILAAFHNQNEKKLVEILTKTDDKLKKFNYI